MLACNKKSDNDPDNNNPDFLFKATFTDDWLSPHSGDAIIFISDNDGNILSEHTWAGNESFEMVPIDETAEFPENINITTVFYKPTTNRFYLTTNLGIAVGSDWIFRGTKAPDLTNMNTVQFNFQNIPDHKAYAISTKSVSRISSGSMAQPFSFSFPESPSDIYLKLNTVDFGVRYSWFNGVVEGVRYDNLSAMKETSSHVVNLPGESSGITMNLYGFPNPGRRYDGAFRIDVLNDYENIYKSITLNYPEGDFSDYRTNISYYDDYTGSTYWVENTFGSFPGNFIKINADFDIENTSINNFEISATGGYIETKTIWVDEKTNNWVVYGPKETSRYKLPILSNYISQLFDLNRFDFKLLNVEIIDYPELETYNDIMQILFNSTDNFFDVVNKSRSRVKIPSDS